MKGLLDFVPLGGQGNHGAVAGNGAGLLKSEAPVHSFATVLQGVLKLANQLRNHCRVIGETCCPGELGGIDLGVACQKVAEHLPEFVFRVILLIISHEINASRCAARRNIFSPRLKLCRCACGEQAPTPRKDTELALFTDIEIDPPRSRRRAWFGWALLGLAVAGASVVASLPAPFVIEHPGPAYNVLGKVKVDGKNVPMIQITGQPSYPAKGALDMLTVSIQGNPQQLPSWFDVASAYLDPQQSVAPVEALYPPGLSVKDASREAKIEMTNSQKEAVAAALHHLDYRFDSSVSIAEVPKGGPAAGVLRPRDVLLRVNGDLVTDVTSLRALVAANGIDHPARVLIKRAGKQIIVNVTPIMSQAKKPAPIFGVIATNNYDFPFEVKINLHDVGGPSAGMMFALGITDDLTPGSATGGREVAGTGTIDAAGTVGAIGGIRQKMYGARNAGADWFLAPKSNCDEVSGHIPAGLHVFAVGTLDDSLSALAKIKSGDTSSLPTCPAV